MKRLILLPLVLVLDLLLPAQVQGRSATYHPTWQLCTEHLDWATAQHINSVKCAEYPLQKYTARPVGHWTETRQRSPHVRWRITYPTFATPRLAGYQAVWEVTYYTDTGQMADGHYTHWGAAACGYDVAMFTRVFVPGVGILVCEDHIGYNPLHHIDVWGWRPGLGNDYRTVTVY